MRYLLTVILVLALASPAWSECITDPVSPALGPWNDGDLVKTLAVDISDCNRVDWAYDFVRTEYDKKPHLTLTIEIVGTMFSVSFPSATTDPGPYSDSGTAIVNSGSNTLSMDRGGSVAEGYFEHIDLWADYYNVE